MANCIHDNCKYEAGRCKVNCRNCEMYNNELEVCKCVSQLSIIANNDLNYNCPYYKEAEE